MPATLVYTLCLALIYLLKSHFAKPQKQLATLNQSQTITS